MAHVAIIGAGELGGAVAHKLASRDRVDEIRLIDPAGGIAAGKALDIQQAAPIEGFRTRITGASELWTAVGAVVVVLADAADTPGEWQGEAGLSLLKRLAQLDSGARFVCAGGSQRRLIAAGVSELRIPRGRLIGSAPGALAAAVRALVALEAGGAASDVSLTALGVPPQQTVITWSAATMRGAPLVDVFDPPALARLAARVPHLWPPGPYSLASAASRVSEAIATGSRRAFSCFVSLDGELGWRGRVAAMPVIVGPAGIERVLDPALSVHERVRLESAVASA